MVFLLLRIVSFLAVGGKLLSEDYSALAVGKFGGGGNFVDVGEFVVDCLSLAFFLQLGIEEGSS